MDTSTTKTRPFRFGLVAAEAAGGAEWRDLARRAEALGYDSLLVPDRLGMLAPGPAVAAAAAVTTTLRAGTFVYAAGLRPPVATAWEARTLATLTDDRFLFGVGAGHPRIAADEAALGLPASTPGQRVAAVAETIRLVREGGTAERRAPAVLVAATRPRMLALAGREADVVALGLAPSAVEDDLGRAVTVVREAAAAAGRACPELSNNLLAVGTQTPPWLARHLGGLDLAALAAAGSIAVLTGSVEEMAEILVRRRDTLGISFVTINAGFADALAPVVARLAGT